MFTHSWKRYSGQPSWSRILKTIEAVTVISLFSTKRKKERKKWKKKKREIFFQFQNGGTISEGPPPPRFWNIFTVLAVVLIGNWLRQRSGLLVERATNGQQMYGRNFNILSHQGTADHDSFEIPAQPSQNNHYQENKQEMQIKKERTRHAHTHCWNYQLI